MKISSVRGGRREGRESEMIDRHRNRIHPSPRNLAFHPSIPGFVSTVHVDHRGALKLLRNRCTQDHARLNESPVFSLISNAPTKSVRPFRIRHPQPQLSSTEHRLAFSDIPDLAGMLPGGSGPYISEPVDRVASLTASPSGQSPHRERNPPFVGGTPCVATENDECLDP